MAGDAGLRSRDIEMSCGDIGLPRASARGLGDARGIGHSGMIHGAAVSGMPMVLASRYSR